MLQVSRIAKNFRGLRAVDEVSFQVPEGAIVGLIGPNGAGKTTIFNMIAGVFPPDEGEVLLQGRNLTGLRPDQVCRAGIGRTFQVVRPFKGLSVEENVTVGALQSRKTVADAKQHARAVLERLGLGPKAKHPASSLTLPDRKRLEVARALATGPKLLLLDEVMAGLRPTELDVLLAVFRDLNREEGLTILLIEHVMRAVMALSDQVVVVSTGQVIAEGPPQEVVRNPKVLECYLGEEID